MNGSATGRVVVSGGAGFIGSHLVDRLCRDGHEVVVVDLLDPAVHPTPPRVHPDVELVRGDVRDVEVWRRVLPGTEAVSHQAAKVGLGVDMGDVLDYVRANDEGTAAMLSAMHELRWRGRLVLASSMVVYGEGAYACATHGPVRPSPRTVTDMEAGRFEPRCPACGGELVPQRIGEDSPVDPRNVYAATKLHQEHLCAAFAREHGIALCSLRYHNVYGPGMPRDTPYAGVASVFRSQLERGVAPKVFEDGGQLRDFVHVEDVASANVRALTGRPDGSGFDGAFNVASGSPITLAEMASVIAEAHGGGLSPQVVGSFRLGDVRHVVGDPARASAVLGFDAQVSPQEGLARFAAEPLRGDAPAPR